MRYIPNSQADRQQMLAEIGVDSTEQLFAGIPEKLRLRRLLDLPKALSESELLEYFRKRASKNEIEPAAFIGAGIYRHYIPIVIDALISRSEFYTAYTPYQAEIAQGTLQAIFEFQTYIAQLTGMEVANASLYDGSTGLAEAVLMAQRVSKKNRFLIAQTVHPEYRAVVGTYAKNLGIQIELIGYTPEGRLDPAKLQAALGKDVAAVVGQSPKFLATRDRYVRQMPGRLVGMGKDQSGHSGFVLTLSTREQHIRREKATSNICTNQSLCALMATVYLATVGPQGLREIAEQNILKTDYAVTRIQSRTKHRVLFPGPRFNEFVVELKDDYAPRAQRLLKNKIVPGISLSRFYPELGNAVLLCVTETARKEQIDALVQGLA